MSPIHVRNTTNVDIAFLQNTILAKMRRHTQPCEEKKDSALRKFLHYLHAALGPEEVVFTRNATRPSTSLPPRSFARERIISRR